MRGPVLLPGDRDYDRARTLWNAMIDRRPAVIAGCMNVNDVIAALGLGREHGLPIAIRGGGHNVTGNAMCDGGIVIDLSRMRRCEVDAGRRMVRVEGGALLGDLDAATQAHGLATPVGINSTTGIAGLTLGGGIGHLMRLHGLTIDNLVALDMVIATGERVRATEDENADLFWAVRGGGGNFGVVTSFSFRLHQVGPDLLSGMILYRAERAREVLRFYQDYVSTAPDRLGTIVSLRNAPPTPSIPAALHGAPIVGIISCYCGDPGEGETVLRPFRDLRPDLYAVEPRPFVEFQEMLNPTVPPGWNYYWKSHYLEPLSDAAVDVIVERAWRFRSSRSYTLLAHMGGAVARVAEDATAFSGRDSAHAININGVWTAEDADRAEDTAWVRGFFDAVMPHATGKAYINFLGNEGQERVRAAYGEAK
ncbi:MAG TPA: FAD-binding oxidoreductase, partial [Candidatus Deferrimicrobiaceae bacterium]